MGAGLEAYQQVLADPRARAFTLAGFVARLPLSMTGMGIVLLVSLDTGSFGRAGLVTAAGTVAGAVAAPVWGRVIDRVGQALVLILAAVIQNVSLALLIGSVQVGAPLPATLAAAVGVGAGFSLAGSCVRARWSHRLADSPLLDTAFAVEAVLDEVVFIVGPVLVTFLATAFHPALGLGVSAAIGLIGAIALAAQRSTQPPIASRHTDDGRAHRLPVRTLLPITLACGALGAIFGGMEVAVVAFATEARVLPFTGAILMCWAFGSLLSGVVTGTVHWRVSPVRRPRVGAVALALSLVPLPFAESAVVVAGLLALSGMAIAPTLIASVAVTQQSVPSARLTEALSWCSTGLAAGLALGAAVIGQLIDRGGAQTGFVGVVGAGVALVISAVFLRSQPPAAAPGPDPAPTRSAAAPPVPPPAESRWQ
ncbi:MAG TPA: MFS transporter [Propionibacteriaceae bacterium]|nr:MFS transporter [Propionibacteriaceae bacterium]